MATMRLTNYLDRNHVRYVSISHPVAFTAQEVAAAAAIPGQEVAKSVMVKLDGEMAMAVLPASHRIDLAKLARAGGATKAELAAEFEFGQLFPECEVGAQPPFGNLWNLRVFVSSALAADDRIAFNAGSHTELLLMSFDDFTRMVNPRITDFSTHI